MIICDRPALRESTPADITGHDSIVCTCGRTIIWKRPCICPMVSDRSSRSVPASISTLGPLKLRNASLSPSYHPRLCQKQAAETIAAHVRLCTSFKVAVHPGTAPTRRAGSSPGECARPICRGRLQSPAAAGRAAILQPPLHSWRCLHWHCPL